MRFTQAFITTCTTAIIGLGVFQSDAAPIVEDVFDYTLGTLEPQGGWDDDNAGVYVVAPVFSQSVTPFTQSGNSIVLNSGRNTHLDITTAADTTYYFSFLIKPSAFDGGSGRIKGAFFENGSNDIFVGFDENGNFGSFSHTSFEDSGKDGTAGGEYFILGKVAVSNEDASNPGTYITYDVSASMYTSAGDVPTTEPATWDTTDSFSYGVGKTTLSEYRFSSRGGSTNIDDARLSTAFSDVAVPEPGTAALAGLGLALIAARRRRA